MRLNDFQGKEVINACDGKKLGYIVDFVFDEKCGQIEAIIIPKTSKFCNFFSLQMHLQNRTRCHTGRNA